METHRQLVRYALVGLASNAVIYVCYLGLTWGGMGHKTAMSLLYAVGVLQTFMFNRSWTFRHRGDASKSFRRYAATYILGYVLNLAGLLVQVDRFDLPHKPVQGMLILVIAIMIFLLQRFWIFADGGRYPVITSDQ